MGMRVEKAERKDVELRTVYPLTPELLLGGDGTAT